MSDQPTCGSCRFSIDLFCHRHPPVDLVARWPMVKGEDWCGEYQLVASTTALPSNEQAALSIVKATANELQAAGDSLERAAKQLKEDGKGYRASQAYQAAMRARHAAEELVGG